MKFFSLQARIKRLYGTQADFAQAIGKREEWVSRVVNGRIKPSQQDKALMIKALNFDENFDE